MNVFRPNISFENARHIPAEGMPKGTEHRAIESAENARLTRRSPSLTLLPVCKPGLPF